MLGSSHKRPLRTLILIVVTASGLGPFFGFEILDKSHVASPVSALQKERISSVRLTNTVTLDGRWTYLDEWQYTDERKMYPTVGTTGDAYLRVKHDSNTLYFLIDAVSDTSFEKDGCDILIDPMNNGGSRPQTDDYRVIIFPQSRPSPGKVPPDLALLQGNGTDWDQLYYDVVGVRAAVGINTTIGSRSDIPHWIYEVQISRDKFPASIIGLGVFASGASYDSKAGWGWPLVKIKTPDTWGEIELSDNLEITEFLSVPYSVILALPILAAFLVLRLPKSRSSALS